MSQEPTPLATARLAGALRAGLAEACAEGDDYALLAAWVDGELSAAEAEGVAAWLAADPEAAATAEALAAIRRELVGERLPAPVPVRVARRLPWAGLAAAAALLVAIGGSWLAGRPAPPDPGTSRPALARAADPAPEPSGPPAAEVRLAEVPRPAPAPAGPPRPELVSFADFEGGTAEWSREAVVLDFESGQLPPSSSS